MRAPVANMTSAVKRGTATACFNLASRGLEPARSQADLRAVDYGSHHVLVLPQPLAIPCFLWAKRLRGKSV
jgi:hypothetical protein